MQIAKIKMQNEKLKQIRQDKELEYGSFDANMNYIGKAWSALLGLETDIPGHMVANMYVVAKLIRTNQKFKQDFGWNPPYTTNKGIKKSFSRN